MKGELDPAALPSDAMYVVTHVQEDELARTKDPVLRARLLEKFETVADEKVPTESWALGKSRLRFFKLSDDKLASALKAELDSLNRGKPNNMENTLIAETAIVNGWTLLTGDFHLAKVAKNHACKVRHFPRPEYRHHR